MNDLGRREGIGPIDALPVEIQDRRFQLLEREAGRQRIEAHSGDVVEHPQLLQLGGEDVLQVDR